MLNVSPFRQSPGHCGVAALKMVLGYYGLQKSERVLTRLARTTSTGTKAEHMVRAAKKLGFSASIKDHSTFNDIKRFLSRGIPVIVDLFSQDDGHYSVVIGTDKNYIYLQDPEIGRVRRTDLTTFKRVWFDFEGDFLKTKKEVILRRLIVIWR